MRCRLPELVAAWLTLDQLHVESVPMWAAGWLVQGYDGPALAELAGLSARDPREVRDLLPDALAEAGVPPLTATYAAVKVTLDDIAQLHLTGRARWSWVVDQVDQLARESHDVLDQPLGRLYTINDQPGEPWSPTETELAQTVHNACLDQTGQRDEAGQLDQA
ncbi:hypothetical protein GCM10009804_41860 [Kribbella hippodromi]|uniref:Uncharacterized protein n=1 Tax=Kribbella hippodromi TaxID=434347 RepID=A0ABP4PGZ3_9ACTN